MDEHYCFFTQKGIDWDEVHERYSRQFDATMTDAQAFEVMTKNAIRSEGWARQSLYTF